MTYEHRELSTCFDHGLVLSPEGRCVRCQGEARTRSRNRRIALALVGLAGFIACSLLWRAVVPTPDATGASPPMLSLTTPEIQWSRTPRITAPETHAALDQWKVELARANAKEATEHAKEAAAAASAKTAARERERQGLEDAERIIAAAEREEQSPHGRVEHPPSSVHDHPSWWHGDPFARRRLRPFAYAPPITRQATASLAPLPGSAVQATPVSASMDLAPSESPTLPNAAPPPSYRVPSEGHP